METNQKQPDNAPANERKPFRKQKINQFIYIEYQNSKPDGHLITLMDSFRNKLGKIHEIKNDETGKREYAFRDSDGNQICKKETVEELKEEIATRKAVMLAQAHQRRIQKNAEKGITQNRKKGKSASQQMGDEAEVAVEKSLKQSREVLQTVTDFVGGEESSRAEEMQQLRRTKGQDRGKGISR